jgi:hypothetical protein
MQLLSYRPQPAASQLSVMPGEVVSDIGKPVVGVVRHVTGSCGAPIYMREPAKPSMIGSAVLQGALDEWASSSRQPGKPCMIQVINLHCPPARSAALSQ